MAKLSDIRVDPAIAESGTWVDFDLGIRLRIAQMPNPAFEREMRRLGRPYMRQIKTARLEDAAANPILERITVEAIAKTVLVGWEHLEDDDGPVPYSPEKALEYLSDPAYGELLRFVRAVASEAAYFRAEAQKDAEGN